MKFNFIPLSGLNDAPKDSTCGKTLAPSLPFLTELKFRDFVDVIGVVKEASAVTEITSKSTQRQVCSLTMCLGLMQS